MQASIWLHLAQSSVLNFQGERQCTYIGLVSFLGDGFLPLIKAHTCRVKFPKHENGTQVLSTQSKQYKPTVAAAPSHQVTSFKWTLFFRIAIAIFLLPVSLLSAHIFDHINLCCSCVPGITLSTWPISFYLHCNFQSWMLLLPSSIDEGTERELK